MNSQFFFRSHLVRKFYTRAVSNTSKPSPLVDSIIRVDHAGELGADRIYAGQMAVLGNSKMGPLIQHMWDQEKVHKATFEQLIVKHRVRPTALVPVWNVAGFLLGAGTALMGEKAAMACTVAVESVIVEHYNDQLRTLMEEPEKNKELMQTIQKFRDDEQEHHDCGIDHGAEQAPFYKALTEVIKFGCKTAIAVSKGLFSQQHQLNYSIASRTYCTSSGEEEKKEQSKRKWDLYSGVCLERKPVLLKPFTGIEEKVARVLAELEVERSHKSDHEIKAEEDAKRAKNYKRDMRTVDVESLLQETAQEFEEKVNTEFESFRIAPPQTEADRSDDLRSLDRELSKHLLFLINENLGGKRQWFLPQGIRQPKETMRETAERVLREKCGSKLKVLFLGNAPCGFYKYAYPPQLKKGIYGAKVFFFKAIYLSGQIELGEKDVDYQWATRKDLPSLVNNNEYYKKISLFLIEDDETMERKEQRA